MTKLEIAKQSILMGALERAKSYVDEHMCYNDGRAGCHHCNLSDQLQEAMDHADDWAKPMLKVLQTAVEYKYLPSPVSNMYFTKAVDEWNEVQSGN